MSVNGLPAVSVTATAQRLDIFSPGQEYAFLNQGTNSVFLRTSKGLIGDFIGTTSALRAASFRAAEIKQDDCLNVVVGNSTVDVVCGNTETATLRICSGHMTFLP